MIILGLTGSIGMGKSTTAKIFARCGVPVYDADAAVHSLYSGSAVGPIGDVFPQAIVDGKVDREILGKAVLGNAEGMKQLENIVHPLVRVKERNFLYAAQEMRARIVVLDIPLLFETNGEGRVDVTVLVSAKAETQRARVLAREGMTEERFQHILEKQLNDVEKRKRAHFVIETDHGLAYAERAVKSILKTASAMA